MSVSAYELLLSFDQIDCYLIYFILFVFYGANQFTFEIANQLIN